MSKELREACKMLDECLGECPLGMDLVTDKEYNCEERCTDSSAMVCWVKYFCGVGGETK